MGNNNQILKDNQIILKELKRESETTEKKLALLLKNVHDAHHMICNMDKKMADAHPVGHKDIYE